MTVVIRRRGRKFGVSDAAAVDPELMITKSADERLV